MGRWDDGEHTNDLDLDVNLDESLGKRVDLDETGVDGAVESSELRDQANVSLRHRFVWIGAEDATRDGPAGADTRA